tara:strand:+ start:95 stop:295 length:201 start_codon:yes stop_codon:yes gene_type:complete
MLTLIATLIVGFIAGALVARNNIKKLNVLVDEAKELAAKAEEELAELKSKAKPPAKRRGRKPTVKK